MINLLGTIFRVIFSLIDRLLIVIINGAYSLLIKLASFNLVDTNTVKMFNQRIGVILGIFMLFTLAIQLLNYIISPDKFSDKSKGGAKLISNVIISLVLLATINFIFETAYKVQFKILEKQLIPQLIFGVSQKSSNLANQGNEISFYLYSSMVNINDKFSDQCPDIFYSDITKNCDNFLSSNLDASDYNSLKIAINQKDASRLLNIGNITAKYNGEFIFDYIYIFSTVISVITILILLGFCIDVSVRIVKLYFLQVIAPIPIISNMVPGKGQEFFKKWYKACFSTFLDLFIRLVALFFATYIITIAWGTLKGTLHDHFLLGVFVILGALIFAKQVPQLVQDLTGFKMDGAFSLNPLKKFDNNPFIGGIAGGFAGSVLGAVNSSQAAGLVGKSRILHGAQGFFTGGARGMMQGSHEKNLPGAIRKGADYSTVGAKKILATKDTTLLGRNLTKIQRRARMKSEADLIEEQLGSYGKTTQAISSVKTASEAFVDKKAALFNNGGAGYTISVRDFDSDGHALGTSSTHTFSTLAELRAYNDSFKQLDTSGMSEDQLQAHAMMMADIDKGFNDSRKEATEQHISEVILGTNPDHADVDTSSAIEQYRMIMRDDADYYDGLAQPDLADTTEIGRVKSGDGSIARQFLKFKDEVIAKKTSVDSSDETRRARANAKYADETRSPRPGPMGPMGNKKP